MLSGVLPGSTAGQTASADGRFLGSVDNERPIYAYPDQAVYSGPAGGQDDPSNWIARNFRRR